MRGALDDAAPLYRDAPEAQQAREAGDRTVQLFMREALPESSEANRALAGDRHGRYVLRLPERPRASVGRMSQRVRPEPAIGPAR